MTISGLLSGAGRQAPPPALCGTSAVFRTSRSFQYPPKKNRVLWRNVSRMVTKCVLTICKSAGSWWFSQCSPSVLTHKGASDRKNVMAGPAPMGSFRFKAEWVHDPRDGSTPAKLDGRFMFTVDIDRKHEMCHVYSWHWPAICWLEIHVWPKTGISLIDVKAKFCCAFW